MYVSDQVLREAMDAFDFGASVVGAMRYGQGHINDTFCVHTQSEMNCCTCFILQRISAAAFANPRQLMDNIIAVTEHLGRKVEQAGGDRSREALQVLRTRDGDSYYTDSEGGAWRVFPFVRDTRCFQQAVTAELFEQSARAFGKFQYMLSDFPADTLTETIPHFHDTPARLEKLKTAVLADKMGRAEQCRAEISFAMARQADCDVLMQAHRDGSLPLRVTHNDTKLNNVLMDAKTCEAICVIDLDTTMPGFSVNDFGDSIRFGANHSAEDEKDLSRVNFDLELYRVYVRGFLEGARGSLTRQELQYLRWGAKVMTLECGIRFLTDYLEGDVYFHTGYPGQNLDRCRTQFKLVQDMEAQFAQMQQVIEPYIQ